MKILIVYAHPEPQSFNGAMLQAAVEQLTNNGHQLQLTDLYATQFSPVSDRSNFSSVLDVDYFKQQLEEGYATQVNGFSELINTEQEKVEWCDLIIWQFPLWWFSVPAILKGWVDRVFAMERFYGQGKMYETGVMIGKRAMLSLTTGGPQVAYLEGGLQGDLNGILRPLQRGIFQFVGFSVLEPQVVFGPARLSADQRRDELNRWKERLNHVFDEAPIEVGIY